MIHVNGKSPESVYPKVQFALQICQSLAILEIFHSVFGLLRSPFFTTFMQVFSRIFMVWMVLANGGPITGVKSWAITSVLLSWSFTEIIRYSFYALKLYNLEPFVLLWLRYSTFIILYPLGIGSELYLTYVRYPWIREHRPYSVNMPNKWNWAFDSWYFTLFFAASYIYGAPALYGHMLSQRAKTLTSSSSSSEDKHKKE